MVYLYGFAGWIIAIAEVEIFAYTHFIIFITKWMMEAQETSPNTYVYTKIYNYILYLCLKNEKTSSLNKNGGVKL